MPAWTTSEVALLGTTYDAAIVAKLGPTERCVQQHRKLLGKVLDARLAAMFHCSRKHVVKLRRRWLCSADGRQKSV